LLLVRPVCRFERDALLTDPMVAVAIRSSCTSCSRNPRIPTTFSHCSPLPCPPVPSCEGGSAWSPVSTEYSELSFVPVCESEARRSLFRFARLALLPSPQELRGLPLGSSSYPAP